MSNNYDGNSNYLIGKVISYDNAVGIIVDVEMNKYTFLGQNLPIHAGDVVKFRPEMDKAYFVEEYNNSLSQSHHEKVKLKD